MQTIVPAAASTGRQAHLYALLSFDALKILVVQPEVRTLEPVSAVHWVQPDPLEVARQIDREAGRWPVFCLGTNLMPLAGIPQSRRMCVLLSDGGHHFGLLCDELTMMEDRALEISALPVCMEPPGCPLTGVAVGSGDLMYLTTSSRLARFLENAQSFRRGEVRGPALHERAI